MKGPISMADSRKLGFAPIAAPAGGVLVVFADDGLRFGARTRALLGSAADLVAPGGLKAARLTVIGTGKAEDRKPESKPRDHVKLGGIAQGRIPASAAEA